MIQAAQGPSTPAVAPATPLAANPRADPAQVYSAFRAEREVLGDQLQSLEYKRRDLVRQLQQTPATDAARKGLEQRIVDMDQRIAAVDKQVAVADQDMARSAAIPGAVVPPTPPVHQGPPDEVYILSGIFMVVVLFPLTIAYARRIWRRGAAIVASLPAELSDRLTRIEQAVDAIAVEVERVGENQRYVTGLLAESAPRALGAGAAEPIAIRAPELAPPVRR